MISQANLIAEAMLAQAQAQVEEPSIWMQLIPLVLMLVVLYLLIIMPNNKRRKEQENMVNSLQKGDTVLTSGGIIGKINGLDAKGIVNLEIADKTVIRILKSQIAGRYDGDKKGSENNKEEKKAEPSASDKK